jgi:DNA-binding transcriptional LysR family regulator
VVARLDGFTSVCALAEAGVGFGLVPSLIASQARELEVLAIDDRLPPRIIGLAWHRDRLRSAAVERFVAAAQAAADDLELQLV